MISGLIEADSGNIGCLSGYIFPLIMISGLIEAAVEGRTLKPVSVFPLIMISGLIEARDTAAHAVISIAISADHDQRPH